MKILLFILLFNLSFGYAQLHYRKMDELKTEFIKTSKMYNVDGAFYINQIDDIYFKLLKSDLLGNYNQNNNEIKINVLYVNNPRLLRAVFYHEVGHFIGLKHLCKDCPYIMSAVVANDFYDMTAEQWEHQMDIYFAMIRTKHKKIIKITIE